MHKFAPALLFAMTSATVLAQEVPPVHMGPKPNIPVSKIPVVADIKLADLSFNEPVPGYLKSLSWNKLPPVWGSGYEKYKGLDDALATQVKKQGIPGIEVAIIRNNELVYSRGIGYSDLGKRTPLLPTQATRVGSISKVMTGLIIFRLVQERKLSLDDKVSDLFKTKVGYDVGQDLAGISKKRFEETTVKDLLEMANGYSGNYMLSYDAIATTVGGKLPLNQNQVHRGFVAANKVPNPVGQAMVYNNTAFMLLGSIAEGVSGKPLSTLIQEHITGPCLVPKSMLHFSPNQSSPNDPARGNEPHYYQFAVPASPRWDGGEGTVSEAYGGLDMVSLGGAGSIAFSAEGLARVLIAVQQGQNRGRGGESNGGIQLKIAPILGKSTWEAYTTPPKFMAASSKTFYRAGQMYRTAGGRFVIEHGATLGHATGTVKYYTYDGDDYQIIVLANSQTPAGIDLGTMTNIAVSAARNLK